MKQLQEENTKKIDLQNAIQHDAKVKNVRVSTQPSKKELIEKVKKYELEEKNRLNKSFDVKSITLIHNGIFNFAEGMSGLMFSLATTESRQQVDEAGTMLANKYAPMMGQYAPEIAYATAIIVFTMEAVNASKTKRLKDVESIKSDRKPTKNKTD